MKKCIIIIILLILWSGPVFSQWDSTRTVSVTVTAMSQIMADNVSWHLNYSVRNKDQNKLRILADEMLSQINDVVNRLGIESANIDFGNEVINKRYKIKKGRTTNKISHYELSQKITFVLENSDSNNEFLNEFNVIKGVHVRQKYFSTQLESTKRQLRIDALDAAKQKAEDFANAVGGTVGDALSISESVPGNTRSDVNFTTDAKSVAMNNRKPDKIDVSARVFVVFELK